MTSHLVSRSCALACAIALCFSVPAIAQDDVDDPDDVIVVEGTREVTVRDMREQALSITPRAGSAGEPLARLRREICAGVFGLSPDSARLVIDRIYYNAERLGLSVSPDEGCVANVVVAVVPDVHAEFETLRNDRNKLIEGLDYWERKAVSQQDAPVLAWNAVRTLAYAGGQNGGRGAPINETTIMGRTNTATQKEIVVSVVMVNASALADVDGVTLADYATMRALAKTRPPIEDISAPTVLALFSAGAAAPDRMTIFDRAYLRSLYAGPGNRMARQAMDRLGSNMKHVMKEGVD